MSRDPEGEAKATYRRAVALEFDASRDGAPKIGVQGENLTADEVVRLAKRFGVPVVERAQLAAALSQLEAGEEIPVELYEAIAALLADVEQDGCSAKK